MNQMQSKNARKIVRISLFIKWLCIAALIIFGASMILDGLSLSLSSDGNSVFRAGQLDGPRPVWDRLALLPYQLSICAVLGCAVGVFHQYATGNIFTARSVTWFRFFALAALASSILNILQGTFRSLFGWLAGSDQTVAVVVDLGGGDLLAIGVAIILLAIAFVQTEAHQKFDEFRLIF